MSQVAKLKVQLKVCMGERDDWKRKYNELQIEFNNHKTNLRKIFNVDQVTALSRKNMKFIHWSDETIEKSISLRYRVGTTAYSVIRDFVPLPTERTLAKRLENFHLLPGVNELPIKFLERCFSNYPAIMHRGVLVFDRMSIVQGVEEDHDGNSIGYDTFKEGEKIKASEGLVALFAGTVVRFKQIIGYHLTEKSINGTDFKQFLLNLLFGLSNHGIWTDAIVCDLGFENVSLLAELGVSLTLENKKFYIPHPVDGSQKLWICLDAVHEFKNIGNNFRTHGAVISNYFVEKYSLSSSMAKPSDVNRVLNIFMQSKMTYKPARKLTDNVLKPEHFSKMRVSTHTRYFSSDVSTTLSFIFEEDDEGVEKFLSMNFEDYENYEIKKNPTSFLFNAIKNWIKNMKNHYKFDLNNDRKIENLKYALNEAIKLFSEIKIGKSRSTSLIGAQMTTRSMIEIMEYYKSIGISSFCPGFFTQDCLENVFSVVRSSSKLPCAKDFVLRLRAQIVSRFTASNVHGSSYDYDSSIKRANISFIDLIRNHHEDKPPNRSDVLGDKLISLEEDHDFNSDFDISNIELFYNELEQNTFYYVIGYILKRVMRTLKCEDCKKLFIDESPVPTMFNRLLRSREKEYNT